jgi:hypothetical protein
MAPVHSYMHLRKRSGHLEERQGWVWRSSCSLQTLKNKKK